MSFYWRSLFFLKIFNTIKIKLNKIVQNADK